MKKLRLSREICMLIFVLFTTISCQKDEASSNPSQSSTPTDKDGNVYITVTIGTQVWMASNLKTTKYNDGTAIPLVTDGTAWGNLTTPGYCWYNNSATNMDTYGALYNWQTVNTGKLCPTGWHVPTDAEWTILTNFLGGESVAGGKLKETGTSHWTSPNTAATNTTGFTALPGGFRYSGGTFGFIGDGGYWWSSTGDGASYAYDRYVNFSVNDLGKGDSSNRLGLSVRCIKD